MLTEPTQFFQKPIFHDHDGSVDDYIALINLLTLDQYRLTGISVSNANHNIDSAVETTLRLLDLFCRKDIQVAKSNETPIHAFPDKWQEQLKNINRIDLLSGFTNNPSRISPLEAADFTAEKILAEEDKTTVILTGPAANIAKTFRKYPEVKPKIEKILWMAGAFLADGNVKAPDHDGSSEWNIYWNPQAASEVFESGVPIYLFPLDVCRELPVDNYLMYQLEHCKTQLCQLVHMLLEPKYASHKRYYMFDVLPSIYLSKPDLFKFENSSVKVELRGTSMGNLYRSSLGGKIKYAKTVDEEAFYDFLIERLKQF